MTQIISFHSFRGGTGKSNTTANIGALMAQQGKRVGIVDTDIQSPGIHILFGLSGEALTNSLNDYLWGRCTIRQAAHDVTVKALGDEEAAADDTGRLFLIPSSIRPGEIARILRDGYNVSLLSEGIRDITRELELDVLLIDTHPGLNEETLLSIAISNTLVIIMRPDQQDFEGTGVTIKVARRLEVERLLVVVNNIPSAFNPEQVAEQVTTAYECPVAAAIPHSDKLMNLASRGLFVVRFPDDEMTGIYRQITDQLLTP